jgi:protein disulfide-isomerase A6
LKGVVNVGAVDMTTDQEVGSPFNVSGYPTIKYFGTNKKSPQDYNSGRDADSIVNFAMTQAQKVVQ